MSPHTQFYSGLFNQVQQVCVLNICKLVKLIHFFWGKILEVLFEKDTHI